MLNIKGSEKLILQLTDNFINMLSIYGSFIFLSFSFKSYGK